ncbi:MAG: DUF1684 domain-containing protein [Betaproteobacteria bacterium]|nr:DUF1684 domain-containing protein [Betaproteobacteria bacterium]
MKSAVLFAAALVAAGSAAANPVDYVQSIEKWRAAREASLRNDNGWLTLAGRFQMKPGANTFGTGKKNDIVFPPELKGVGPETIGTFHVDATAKKVTLKLTPGTWMSAEGKAFTGERSMGIGTEKRDWIALGRMAMHIIERDGKYILRLANNESKVRSGFKGRIWYPADESFKVEAKYTAYPPGKSIPIVNVIDEISDTPCPGYVEFKLKGVSHKLDVVGNDNDGLFFVLRDGTSGDTTYRPSRFLFTDKKPQDGETFTLDFNKTYNPPCAFSEFTTCPLPPEQNILKTRIEAGEKVRKTS